MKRVRKDHKTVPGCLLRNRMVDPPDFGYTSRMGYGRCILMPIKEEKRTCGKCWRFRIYKEGDACRRNGSYAYFKDMNPGDTPCNSFEWKYPYSPESLYHYTECGECGELYQTGGLWHKCKPEKLNKENKNMSKKEIRDLKKRVEILEGEKLEADLEKVSKLIPWPVIGDYYYFVGGDVVQMDIWQNDNLDKMRMKNANVFKHRHEAERKIKQKIQKDEAIIKEFAEKLEEQEKSFPVDGKRYWFISVDGDIYDSVWADFKMDKERLEAGNCFESYQEAVRERNHQMLRYRARKAAGEAWEVQKSKIEFKYTFYRNEKWKQISLTPISHHEAYFGEVYFPTRDSMIQFIKNNRELIDKIYNTQKYKLEK